MASSVSIEVNVDPEGKVNAALGGMDARWQASTAKWGAAVDNFKNNVAAYNAVLKEGGERLAVWDAAMARAGQQGANLGQQMEAASQELVNFTAQAERAGDAAEYNMGRARMGAYATSQALGVGGGLGRDMAAFISQNKVLGPLVENAFSAVAIIAMADVVVHLGQEVVRATDWMGGLTDAVRKQTEEVDSWNRKLLVTFDTLAKGRKFLDSTNEQIVANEELARSINTDAVATQNFTAMMFDALVPLARWGLSIKAVNDLTDKSTGLMGTQTEQLSRMNELAQKLAEEKQRQAQKDREAADRAAKQQDELNQRIERAIAERDERIFKAQEAAEKKQEKLDEQSLASALKIIEEIEKADEKRVRDHQLAADELAKVDAQTLKMQQDAAIGALPQWQRAAAQAAAYWEEAKARIIAQFDQIRDHFKGDSEQLAQLGKDEAAQMVAAQQQANDKIVDAHRQMVDKLASELDTLFTDMFDGHFTQHIMDMAKKFGEKLLASLLLGIGSGQGQQNGSGGGMFGSSILGGLLGKLFGGGSGGGGGFGFPIPGVSGNNSGGFNFGGGGDGGGGGDFFGLGSPDGGVSLGNDGGASTFGLAPLAAGGTSGGTGIGASLAGTLNNAPLAQIFQKIAPNFFSHGIGSASGAAIGAAGAEIGLASILGAFSTGSKTFGVLGGAAGGALLGFSIGGPLGAGIGAVVGAIAGLFAGIFGGNRKKHQAQDMDNQKFLPALSQLEQAYENYQVSYADEQKQMSDLENQAQQALGQFGSQGKGVYNNEFLPQAQAVQRQIDAWEKDRQKRASIHFAPPEFHDGGEVPAILLSGETVMNRGATSRHRNTLRAMNEGSYSGSGEVHIHLHTIDGASTEDWLTKRGGIQKIQRALMTDFLDYNGSTIA